MPDQPPSSHSSHTAHWPKPSLPSGSYLTHCPACWSLECESCEVLFRLALFVLLLSKLSLVLIRGAVLDQGLDDLTTALDGGGGTRQNT